MNHEHIFVVYLEELLFHNISHKAFLSTQDNPYCAQELRSNLAFHRDLRPSHRFPYLWELEFHTSYKEFLGTPKEKFQDARELAYSRSGWLG